MNTQRYGTERVKRGLAHFIIGKGVSAIAGVLAMLLVVRSLTISEFAGYSILVALVEVFTAISGLGLAHLVLRYVPEIYAGHRTNQMQKLILACLKVRTFVLFLALLCGWYFAESISAWVGLSNIVSAFKLFLIVVAFRSTVHFLSQILESTLHQSYCQASFSISAILRLLGFLALLQFNKFDLINVILLEAGVDMFACCFLFWGVYNVARRKGNPDLENANTDKIDSKGMVKFAWAAYLQHLATLPFGGNTNRLVGGAMFSEVLMAKFGFAQTLYEYTKRYLPAQLLIGLIRPIVVARYTTNGDFTAAADLCEKTVQVNLVILSGVLSLLLVNGSEILMFISNNKYGVEGASATLLSVLIVFLMFETQRLILELILQMVEHYEVLITNNLFLSTSIFLGVVTYPIVGAVAFPLANTLALIISNALIISRLKKMGFLYQVNWKAIIESVLILVISVAVGCLFNYSNANWLIATVITAVIYTTLFFKLKFVETRQFVRDLIGKQ